MAMRSQLCGRWIWSGAIASVSILLVTSAHAQSNTPSTSSLTMQGPAEQSGVRPIRDALGRPCLDIEAAARSHVVNPNVVDHVISLKNGCSRNIKVKVCYYHSDQCKESEVQGYKRVDTILGTMTKASSIFRYTVFQR